MTGLSISFAHREAVHLLWGVIVLSGVLAWLEMSQRDALSRFMSKVMQRRLAARVPTGRRATRALLLFGSLASGVLALMRPQTPGQLETISEGGGEIAADIMVVLDVSRSMLAEDAAPSRLGRAKAEVLDLLARLKGQRMGLVAFAGRAQVLCPLTPDYGFFRMILEGAGTNSVSRGGTRIGDGIRTALHAFSAQRGGRLILLITDGEDHDSFPLDAAEAARKAGVRIVAIGFGDERGSEITLTDPKTGARSLLVDREGTLVRSRLDGKMLREIALKTEGAYVPAGVAALDLDSIIKEHIRPLLQDQAAAALPTRAVPREHYPWLLLLSLLLLLSWALLGTLARRVAPATLALLLLSGPRAVGAEGAHAGRSEREAPRRTYNQARLAYEAGDLKKAEEGFLKARDQAGVDEELRYRAAFNLGLTCAARAFGLMKDKKDEAMTALNQAAAWFRDAVRARAGSEGTDRDARVNLEIVLRRIQQLADEMNKGQNRLEARLGRIIQDQRTLRDRVRGLIGRVGQAAAQAEPLGFQPEFEEHSTFERTLFSDAGAILDLAGDERALLEKKAETERSEEERARLYQLENMEHYLGLARGTMLETSRLLRRLQGDKALARADQAITELKRALEQLLDPVTVLRGLVADQTQVRTEGQVLDQIRRGALKLENGAAPATPPPWLSVKAIAEEQRALVPRLREIEGRLRAGTEGKAGQDAAPAAGPDERRKQRVLAAAREAAPLLAEAGLAMEQALSALSGEELQPAGREQTRAITAMVAALERFSGIRDLIELCHGEQALALDLLTPEKARERREFERLSGKERAELLRGAHTRNLDRLARLKGLFEDELLALGAMEGPGQAGAQQPRPDAESIAAERARYEKAEGHRKKAEEALARMGTLLGAPGPRLREPVAAALREIAELRRLFFSIVEHLKELLRNQGETHDQTSSAQAQRDPAEKESRLGPLATAQAGHAQIGQAIADALAAQADQAQDDKDEQREARARLAQASEEVRKGQGVMADAARMLEEDSKQRMSVDLAPVLEKQRQAMAHLEQALRILEPEQKQGEDQDQKHKDQKEEERQVSQEQAAQRLQAIREREAERRRRQDRPQPPEPVEKDW